MIQITLNTNLILLLNVHKQLNHYNRSQVPSIKPNLLELNLINNKSKKKSQPTPIYNKPYKINKSDPKKINKLYNFKNHNSTYLSSSPKYNSNKQTTKSIKTMDPNHHKHTPKTWFTNNRANPWSHYINSCSKINFNQHYNPNKSQNYNQSSTLNIKKYNNHCTNTTKRNPNSSNKHLSLHSIE